MTSPMRGRGRGGRLSPIPSPAPFPSGLKRQAAREGLGGAQEGCPWVPPHTLPQNHPHDTLIISWGGELLEHCPSGAAFRTVRTQCGTFLMFLEIVPGEEAHGKPLWRVFRNAVDGRQRPLDDTWFLSAWQGEFCYFLVGFRGYLEAGTKQCP